MKTAVCWLLGAALVVACSGDVGDVGDDDDDDDDNVVTDGGPSLGDPDADVPASNVIRLEIDSYDVRPGTERQVCKLYNLPVAEAVDVIALRSSMAGTSHHFNVYKALGDSRLDPIASGDGVVHDCSPAAGQLQGTEAFFYGAALPEGSLDLPPGIAFHLEAGQVIILEHHSINVSDSEIQGKAYIDLVLAPPDATIEHYADVMWLGNWFFAIPPGQETTATERCTIDYDIEVMRLSSHYHSTGTHFSIEHWKPPGSTEHRYDSYDWEHPEAVWFDIPMSIKAGEGIEWSCTWFNTRGATIYPGETSTDEMCIAFGLGYPKNTLSAEPISCNPPWF